MKPYQLSIPTKIYFGRNIWKEAIHSLESLLQGNILLVTTGRSLIRMGYVKELKDELAICKLVKNVTVFEPISANPKLSEVQEGICLGKKEKVDIVVGFGGGSAMDAAKAIAAGIGTDRTIEELFYDGKEPEATTLPVIAIPTTAGTGSELSKAAILTDDKKKIKNGIRGEALYPKVAIVDSVFTESVPYTVTMETGFDVLAHAIESYLSLAASPYTQMLSEYTIQTVGIYLPRLAVSLNDTEAREKMSFVSMLMGVNLGNASTCLPHRLQYPLGAHTDSSHGAGLAALFSAWVEQEVKYVPDKIKKVITLLKGQKTDKTEYLAETIRQFIKSLGLPTSLQELGVEEAQLYQMAAEVSGNIKNDPLAQEEGIILHLYKKAWQEER